MATAGVTADRTGKPNRLLRGFVIISLGIHAFVLGHMAGLYKSDAIQYIELEMGAAEKPPGRDIPAIPRPEKIRPSSDTPMVRAMSPVVAPVMTAPVAAPSVIEPMETPQMPDVSESEPAPEAPSKNAPDIETAPGAASAAHGMSEDYFGMVRRIIESRKKYPYTARKRQIQGRVVVHFTIGTNGRVENLLLKKGSGYGVLDQAALTAVRESSPFPRPPAHLFHGSVPLEIGIVFELM